MRLVFLILARCILSEFLYAVGANLIAVEKLQMHHLLWVSRRIGIQSKHQAISVCESDLQ